MDDSPDEGRNRRRHARIPAEAVPGLTARVVGGPLVRLLDVSRRGVRVETEMPMKPGRPVTMRFVAADRTMTLTGAVVRSSVAVLCEDGVKYHTALSFAEDVQLCPDVPPAVVADDRREAPEPMPRPVPPAESRLGPTLPTAPSDLMVAPAPDDTGDALRARLFDNSW